MSVEAIDRALGDWDERLRRIDESLLALEAEPTYQMLAPRSASRPLLAGETAERVLPALEALGELFEHRGRLTEVLERARQIRRSMSTLAFWGVDEKEAEIAALLQGPSIELPPQATPLAARTLLDPGAREVRVVPGELLAAMAAAYDRARDAVVAVRLAWDRLEPALADLDGRLEAARASAEALGVTAGMRPELDELALQIGEARARVASDPFGASDSVVEGLRPRLEAFSARMADLAGQRRRVEAELLRARAAQAALRETHAAARAAVDAMPREVEGARATGAPVDDRQVDDLGPWLDRIAETAAQGRWGPAEVGLGRWHDAAGAALANDGAIAGALTAVVARRDELLGRLSARRAQAAARSARGSPVDAGADDVAREAARLLALRPTPLARASSLVERYEAAVAAAAVTPTRR